MGRSTRLEAEGAEFLVLGHLLIEGIVALSRPSSPTWGHRIYLRDFARREHYRENWESIRTFVDTRPRRRRPK